jgi:hypothetical protein
VDRFVIIDDLDDVVPHQNHLVQINATTGLTKADMLPLVAKWDSPPTAIQILEVLDYCIFSALASGGIVTMLQGEYKKACEVENTTHEQVVGLATWRKTE